MSVGDVRVILGWSCRLRALAVGRDPSALVSGEISVGRVPVI